MQHCQYPAEVDTVCMVRTLMNSRQHGVDHILSPLIGAHKARKLNFYLYFYSLLILFYINQIFSIHNFPYVIQFLCINSVQNRSALVVVFTRAILRLPSEFAVVVLYASEPIFHILNFPGSFKKKSQQSITWS